MFSHYHVQTQHAHDHHGQEGPAEDVEGLPEGHQTDDDGSYGPYAHPHGVARPHGQAGLQPLVQEQGADDDHDQGGCGPGDVGELLGHLHPRGPSGLEDTSQEDPEPGRVQSATSDDISRPTTPTMIRKMNRTFMRSILSL